MSMALARENSGGSVTVQDYERKLAEIDRLLNDPAVSLDPARVWALLADIAHAPLLQAEVFSVEDGEAARQKL
jgi:hypothetical protein